MRRLLSCCVFSLLASTAFAGEPPTCYPWETDGKEADVVLIPSDPITWLTITNGQASLSVTWWCRDRYRWYANGFYGFKDEFISYKWGDKGWLEVVAALKTMSHSELDELWSKGVTCAVTDASPQCQKYIALAQVYSRQVEATRPPPIIWAVKDSVGGNERPVYRASNGIRSTTPIANERVSDVATVCDCIATAVEESGGTYCSVEGARNTRTQQPLAAGRVALCEERNSL